jgi:hypothetical protein
MNEKIDLLRIISNRLARVLGILVAIFIPAALFLYLNPDSVLISTPVAAFTVGVIGGFVGLQRRLKKMPDQDLSLLAHSWVYICLSPLVGGILAVITYILFLSGLLEGDLFPSIVADIVKDGEDAPQGLPAVFAVHGETPADYGKILFWSFLAGFSERFATDIISRFETQASGKE